MKRFIALFAVIALAAGMASAAPTIYGSNGMFRTISAENAGPMNFGIGFHAYGWGWYDTTSAKNMTMHLNVPIEGYFSINDMFELSVAPVYQMNSRYYPVYAGTPPTATMTKISNNGLLDTRAGLKFSYKTSESMILGLYAGYDIPTISDTLNPGHASTVYKHNGAIAAKLLDEMKFGDGCLNINAGLDYSLDKYEVGGVNYMYPNMAIPFGVGFSYKLGFVTPIVELNGAYVMDTTTHAQITGYTTAGLPTYGTVKRGLLNNPTWATLVLRFGMGVLNIDLGGEYNLQTKDTTLISRNYTGLTLNNTEHWHAIFGLAYAPVKESGPKVPATGIIAGKVTDSKGKPLAATISVAGMTFNADPATGNYTAGGIQITGAPVEVKADLKGYISKTGSVVLTKKNKKTPATQDFVLELKPIPMGTAKGMVKDQMSGAPLDGTVMIGAHNVAVKQGAYSGNLPAGDYTGVFQILGYFEKTVALRVTDRGTAINDAMLLKKGSSMTVDVTWKSLGSTIQKSINVDMIAKAYKDNPRARVVVTAYVDRAGETQMNQKLADGRANMVKQELIKASVPGDRITTKGVVVTPTGKTKAIKEANTKVEVTLE